MFRGKLFVGNLLIVEGLDRGGYLLPKQKHPIFLHKLNAFLRLLPNCVNFLSGLFIPWLRNFVFDILVGKNIVEFLAYNSFDLVLLFPLKFVFLISLGYHNLIGSMLSKPKKMLVELSKLLVDGPLPSISCVLLSDANCGIDYLHNELSIISIFFQNHKFFILLISAHIEVISDLNSTCEDEIVLFIISSVDVCDDLSHSGGAS